MQALGFPTLFQYHIVLKEFDGHPFSAQTLVASYALQWGGKTLTVDVEVLDAPIYYNFLLGHSWIHVMMAIASSKSQVIRFPHWGKFVTTDQ